MQSDIKPMQLTALADVEYNGQLNRSTGQGAKFGLLLSMLHADILTRPRLEDEHHGPQMAELDINGLNHYPEIPLSAQDRHWTHADRAARLMQESPRSSQLWLCMHPEPLAQKNDPSRIDEHVIANCSLQTQQRFSPDETDTQDNNALVVDETGLYDILATLNPQF